VSELNDISNQNSLRRKYYTARDRVFFSKVASIRSGYEEFRKRMDIINRSEVALNEVIKMCDLEAAGSMESIIVRFQGHFQRIFQRIVPESSCQVTFQRHTERIRGNERTQNSLDIRVSFDRGVPQKKWTTFSGGEKTIIALTLVMAVQECDPAPFYVFDEVDSALDAIYRKRIAQL
jgi:structural maintenance of chromosome 3 (chondroitin sulfate proteoglycan 6)